jgi:hypothetical protein
MQHKFEAFQFLSRKTIEEKDLGVIRSSPQQRPDIRFEMSLQIVPKPFEMTFAQLKAEPPSIGASQYVDTYIDRLLTRRWPSCIAAHGIVEVPDQSLDDKTREHILTYPRTLLWDFPYSEIQVAIPKDQRALFKGYRREFFNQQIFDISGKRRPSTQATYVPTDQNEPTGPGVVTFREWDVLASINEFVWSPILSFRNRTTFDNDKPAIQRALKAFKKHYNGYSEFFDAERYVEAGDIKAAVRSAASSVDAILRYYIDFWDLSFPPGNLTFDEKIDNVLQRATRPTYSAVNPTGAENLRFLYRCRNSMHEGDCYYKNNNGTRVDVRRIDQVTVWVETVTEFIIWIDSLA